MTSLATINRAIAKAGIQLELVRGEGYHYFIYDQTTPDRDFFETESVMVCYTKTYTKDEWVDQAQYAMEIIEKRIS
jgi:hypothetical protein